MGRLILFDIDGTLLVTAGAGIAAMRDAGRTLFDERFSVDGLEFAGRLDPLLLVELLQLNSQPVTAANLDAFRRAYHQVLAERAQDPTRSFGRALPGVLGLLEKLRTAQAAMGLLTGNFAETGAIKLRCCGIDPAWFNPAVWGDDSSLSPPSRDHLPAIAMDRARSLGLGSIHPGDVLIVGDTPADVRCARANGCRSVAVATGKYNMQQLKDAGADRVLQDLSDVDRVFDLLT